MRFRLTKVVKTLAIINFAAFIIQQTADRFFGTELFSVFALVPNLFVTQGKIWQIFTYAFLHADITHLFLNLLMLIFIGSELESAWGWKRFTKFYFTCSTGAAVFYLLLVLVTGSSSGLHSPMVGASGAIYGMLIAYGMLFGERVLLFMLVFPMKAKHFIWILAGMEFLTTVYSPHGGLSGFAHLGGMFTGFMYLIGLGTWLTYRDRIFSRTPVSKRSHLRLVVNRTKKTAVDDEEHDSGPKTWH